jgi:hypothetical protein
MSPLYWELIVTLAGAGLAKLIVDLIAPRFGEVFRWSVYLSIVAALVVAQHQYILRQNAPRRLALKQQEDLLDALIPLCAAKSKLSSSEMSDIGLLWIPEHEAEGYADDFAKVFDATKCWYGYRSSIGVPYSPSFHPVGLILATANWNNRSDAAAQLVRVLDKNNVKFERTTWDRAPRGVVVIVGSKP